jgi:Pyridoxamine 5'-phosphate oxidase
MTPEERDAFLACERTCRVATVGGAGQPHVTPMWYAWDGRALWLYSLSPSRRGAHLRANPWVAVVVDAGTAYDELRGVELAGRVEMVGEHPRTGLACPEVEEPERLWGDRYLGGHGFPYDGRHGWLRLVPEREVSWDFRKLAG